MLRKFAITALGAATLLAAPVPALAMPFGNGLPVVKTDAVQLVDHRRYRRNRYYRDHNRHNDNGAAALAAIIGLGALLALSNNNRRDVYYDDRYYGYQSGSQDWKVACAGKYRSFEWNTGLYTTNSGYKRQCRLP